MSASFTRMAIVTATTKRPPAVSGGKRGEPVAHLAAFRCTPLDPVSAEVQQRVALNTPMKLLQTVTRTMDIREGDVLVVGAEEYPIRSVGAWHWTTGTSERFLAVVVEDLKR